MIKKALILYTVSVTLITGCSIKKPQNKSDNKLNVFVTVIPQIGIVKQIGGQFVNVKALVTTGSCPETFSPSPIQIRGLSDADVFISLGLPFEQSWLKKVSGAKSNINIKIMTDGIKFRQLEDAGDSDPHVWMSLRNSYIMAQNTAKILSELMPQNTEYFNLNLKIYENKIKSADDKLKEKFKNIKDRNIYIFHPVFGYFADDYGLKQIPIEMEGKEPSAKQLVELMSLFKKNNVKIIFVEPEFSS
ncbi:MAG: zinc ABC transporter substrate-binding protein, partial [Proteobacteria bacterium]|nr:zinc ABC transporter substrate-binding protein [Pseudomonadota bacterium]